MRSIWKGAISFGLVTIPIRVFTATEEKNISFRQVHASDGGRIKYKRICEVDGEEVPFPEIAKGYELPDGDVLVLQPEDLADLPLPSSKAVDVLEFVPFDQIDPTALSKAYYLGPDSKVAEKPYVLLREALKRSDRVAVVKVALRNREALAFVRAVDDTLVMHTMLWPDEVRDAGEVAPSDSVSVSAAEVSMAESFIDTLTADFDAERYKDVYREALEQVIEAKLEGHEVEQPAASAPSNAEVVDLLAALRASVAAAKRQRGEEPASDTAAADEAGSEEAPAKKAAAKRAPAKETQAKETPVKKAPTRKTPAEKTAAKKSPAKKTAAKKSPAKKTAAKRSTSGTDEVTERRQAKKSA
jgi:DNA end-binding protein Ku